MIRHAAVIVAASAAVSQAQVWNPTAEFSVTNGNPNGVWSYGWYGVGFTGFHLHTTHRTPAAPFWGSFLGADGTPCTWINNSPTYSYGIAPYHLSIHPGPGSQPSVVRWTNPGLGSGTLAVVGAFTPGDVGSMQVGVLSDGTVKWHATNFGAFDLAFDAATTTTIEFAVYGGYAYGNTGLDVTISISSTCTADFNHDGGVDGADVEAFFASWVDGLSDADFNQDGGVDGADVEAFFARWVEGC